jgi:hypothetical protein
MDHSFSTMDLVVFVAMAFVVALTVAWLVSPALRGWMERPKYRFQENVRTYDERKP